MTHKEAAEQSVKYYSAESGSITDCMGDPIFVYCPFCGAKMDLKDGDNT